MKKTTFTAVTCSALVAGCCCPHQQEQAEIVTVYGGATTPTYSSSSHTTFNAEEPSVADSELVSEVRAAINSDPMLRSIAPSIHVTANNGTVTLTGNVSNEDQILRVNYLAKGTSRVVTVNNQLQVLPSPTGRLGQSSAIPTDESSAAVAVRDIIVTDPYLKGAAQDVHIEVVRGGAILRGVVVSENDRREVARRIGQVPGITVVDNRLEVVVR
jgi:osmotically-inducible protein OsmY